MTTPESDERAMGRLARGDDSALDTLMQRWAGPIWCLIDRMCGSQGCTEDIYQEAWMRVYLYRRRYQSGRPFRPYLFTIAMNCCRSALSRGKARAMFFTRIEDAPEPPSSPDPPPIEVAIAGEHSALLHRAIANLPRMQRAVVLLHLLYDSSHDRIARILNKSTGTVRSHMHHALKNLRAALAIVVAAESESQVDHERHADRKT